MLKTKYKWIIQTLSDYKSTDHNSAEHDTYVTYVYCIMWLIKIQLYNEIWDLDSKYAVKVYMESLLLENHILDQVSCQ